MAGAQPSTVARLWNTVRHLRGRQIAGQISNRFRRLYENPTRWARREVPAAPGWAPAPQVPILPPGMQANPAAGLRRGRFEFLNEAREIGWPPNWDASGSSLLWRYNLHYFEWLWALDYLDARDAVGDWIRHHPPGRGRVGWDPYPVSLRLMNWLAVFGGTWRRSLDADPATANRLWESVWLQAEWLLAHREDHLMGNHLIENGAALAVAGSFFPGDDAGRWFRAGCDLLAEQIPEQVLADGMHFERSPMYHSRILYLLLLLNSLGRPELDRLVQPVGGRMVDALDWSCHPDGGIALLNDSAHGIYNDPRQLLTHGRRRFVECDGNRGPVGPWSLPDAGYFGYRDDAGTYLVCDAGPIGPDYLPGHAHGDIFSFELSLAGSRVIVDAGVHDYETGEMRRYCRSTGAHNTVEIDGVDQCEFWDAFRVARRGRPRGVKWEPRAGGFRLEGRHDGYARLAGSPVHQRRFHWKAPGTLQIDDRVTAERAVAAVSRLHFHPDCRVEPSDRDCAHVVFPGGTATITFTGLGVLSREESLHCPEFGRKQPNTALAWSARGADIETGIRIELT